jgi:hypothetical protein
MEAEKFHDLPSASWRPRAAGGVHSKSKGLRTREGDRWCNFQSEKMRSLMAHTLRQKKEDPFLLTLPLVLVRLSLDCVMFTHTGKGSHFLTSPIHMLISSGHTSQAHPETMVHLCALCPLSQSSWLRKLTTLGICPVNEMKVM